MEYKITTTFKPITLTLTLNTKEELGEFFKILGSSNYSKLPGAVSLFDALKPYLSE